MAQKKLGRPPSKNPLVDRIFIRVDESTKKMLNDCTTKLNATRSDVVRKGIQMVHDTLKNE